MTIDDDLNRSNLFFFFCRLQQLDSGSDISLGNYDHKTSKGNLKERISDMFKRSSSVSRQDSEEMLDASARSASAYSNRNTPVLSPRHPSPSAQVRRNEQATNLKEKNINGTNAVKETREKQSEIVLKTRMKANEKCRFSRQFLSFFSFATFLFLFLFSFRCTLSRLYDIRHCFLAALFATTLLTRHDQIKRKNCNDIHYISM